MASLHLPAKIALVVAVVGLTYLAGTRTGVESVASSGDREETLILWRTSAAAAPLAAAASAWTTLLVWSRRATASGRPRTWAVVGTLGAAVGAWFLAGFDPFGGWTVGTPIVASDGSTYRPAWSWWTAAIVRDERATWDRKTASVVARAQTDSPRRYAVLISRHGDRAGGVREAEDGTLVLDQVPHCYVAYEPRADRSIVGDDLVALSPFLLLGPTEEGTNDHLAELEAEVARARIEGAADVDAVVPDESTMLRALESPSNWVRTAARRIVVAGGDSLFPKASKLR